MFFLGQVFTFAALARGDVSVVTPLLGMKVILVTVVNAVVFSMVVPLRWWLAAIASSMALVLITMGPSGGKRRAVFATAMYSLCAAAAFSLTDAVVQHWGGSADSMAYLPAMFGSVAVISTVFYALTNRVVFDVRGYGSAPLIVGGLLLALQATGVFVSLVWSRDATAVNVVYSSRSVWSVVLAWAGGAAFGLKEGGLGVMLTRLAGALLLFGSILLILA
jgi:lipoprotein signal peptidase